MRKTSALILTVLFFAVTFLPSAPAQVFKVEIFKKEAHRDMEIIPLVPAAAGPDQKVKVRFSTTATIFAREHHPNMSQPMSQNLGQWNSDLTVWPSEDGRYPADVSLSLKLPGGTTKKVERRFELENSMIQGHAAQESARLRNDFIELVRNEFWPMNEELSQEFDKVLVEFSDKHIKEVFSGLPEALQKMKSETQRRHEVLTQRVEEKNVETDKLVDKTRGNFLSVLQEGREVDEEGDFVEIQEGSRLSVAPQYTRRLSFHLTALAENRVDRYRIAAVSYHMKTVPFADGQFRSNFRLDVDYMMRDKKRTSINFVFEAVEKDNVFFEKWKSVFWKKASAKIINAGKTEEDKMERAYFITLLERYLFEEQYQFPVYFTKAKLTFQSDDTRKELAKLRKSRGL